MTPASITSSWLREYRPAGGILPIPVDVALMLAGALEIADRAARTDIELYAVTWEFKNRLPRYYKRVAKCPEDERYLQDAIAHLGARGLLEVHPEVKRLFRILEAAKVGA